MMNKKTPTKKMIVTAALPYANGAIHLGHMVEHCMVDFWVRFQKMQGHDCIFICADDTHGTPIMVKAREMGMPAEKWIELSLQEHTSDLRGFQIHYDHYSWTHSPENTKWAHHFFAKMQEAGSIEVRKISQAYCPKDNMFLPDRYIKGICPKCHSADQYGDNCDKCGATYSPTEMRSPQCTLCGTTPITKDSDHIFFKLNNYKEFLQEWVAKHTQKEVGNKLQEWFNEDLRDWDISRDAPYFGIEIPGFANKFFYVWLDAPIGYISTTEQYCKQNGKNLEDYWRHGEIYHFIGKDILYFHTLFWPAMLKAAGFNPPNFVNVHGFLTVNGEKMSKSKGTFISARSYLQNLDPLYYRFFLATRLTPTMDDLDLNLEDFATKVNADLIGKITNLGSRGAQMLNKRLDSTMGKLTKDALALVNQAQSRTSVIAAHFEAREFSKALNEIKAVADEANRYFDQVAPWKLINENPEATREALTSVLNVFRLLSIWLKPILPEYASKVEKLFHENPWDWSSTEKILTEQKIGEYSHLAVRMDMEKVKTLITDSAPAPIMPAAIAPPASKSLPDKLNPTSATDGIPTPSSEAQTPIDFEDFAKIDLRIAKILEAENIAEADKLLRLKVDLGALGTRQIIAGIKSAYQPQDLVGRLTVIVANLKPRKMKFGISEGMILAAGNGGKELYILSPDSGALPGQKVK